MEDKVGSISICWGVISNHCHKVSLYETGQQKHEFVPRPLDYRTHNLITSPLCETGNASQSFPSSLLKNGSPHSKNGLDFEECSYTCTLSLGMSVVECLMEMVFF